MQSIKIIDPHTSQALSISNDGLVDKDGNKKYPYLNGAFRIVQGENYTDNFGLEWNEFQKTQIDKYSQKSISHDRFFAQTRWHNIQAEENILEVGSGAGRFSQIVLDHTPANLYSLDFSSAVEANYRNNGPNDRFNLFQASIYEMPFEKEQFDKVFCLGVLQHTPDVKKSIDSLIEMVKPGGEIVVDFYPIRGWYSKVNAKYMLRPLTKRMKPEKLMRIIRKNTPWLMKWYSFNKKIGLGVFNRFVPICDIDKTIPEMDKKTLTEWVILDTFDVYSPQYDQPQRLETVKNHFISAGLENIDAQFITYGNGFQAATVKGRKAN